MARIRTIKPDFWRDENLAAISPEAALLAIGLLNHADDEGYFNAHPKLIESDIFPLRELSRPITVMVDELFRIGYIQLFQGVDGKRYGHIYNFSKHQVINKKNPSKIKELCNIPEDYCTTTVELPVGMEGNGMEKEKELKKSSQRGSRLANDFVLPEEWVLWADKERPDLSAKHVFEQFKDYWCAKPGKDGVKLDWQATWRNWVRNQKSPKQNPADIIKLTVPASNEPDAALEKIKADARITRPPTLAELAKMAELRKAKA
jgi:hypothetical protein